MPFLLVHLDTMGLHCRFRRASCIWKIYYKSSPRSLSFLLSFFLQASFIYIILDSLYLSLVLFWVKNPKPWFEWKYSKRFYILLILCFHLLFKCLLSWHFCLDATSWMFHFPLLSLFCKWLETKRFIFFYSAVFIGLPYV